MLDFTESLRQLVVAEKIERATAFEVAPNVEYFENGAQRHYHRATGHSLNLLSTGRRVPRRPLRGVPSRPGRGRTPLSRAAGVSGKNRKVSDDPSAPRPRDVCRLVPGAATGVEAAEPIGAVFAQSS